MDGKCYTVYRVIGPGGMIYHGYTSMSVSERWRRHKARAVNGEAPEHPFYNAIRQYGPCAFDVSPIDTFPCLDSARYLEELLIRITPASRRYNLSKGGDNDASEGGRIFWERINSDPVARVAFIKKLSDRKKANDWTDYAALTDAAAKWRHDHVREAYRIAHRAQRIAARKLPKKEPEPELSLKERLFRKHKPNAYKARYVTEVWAHRDADEKAAIFKKISEAHKANNAAKSAEERRKMTERSRACIDREKQGAAASAGIKGWWDRLRSDPEAYRAYIERRKASLLKTIDRKREEATACEPTT